MRTILETQNGMAGDVVALRGLLEHVYGAPATDVDLGEAGVDIGDTDADAGETDADARRPRSWWWPFRRAG
jgi:hypothetical protein